MSFMLIEYWCCLSTSLLDGVVSSISSRVPEGAVEDSEDVARKDYVLSRWRKVC